MPASHLVYTLKRILSKPPHVILKRIMHEIKIRTGCWLEPYRAKQLTTTRLLTLTHSQNIDKLWTYLSSRPYPAYLKAIDQNTYQTLCDDQTIILHKAQQALNHQVNLLGSGLVTLGQQINWHKDYKSGYDWPPAYFQHIHYNNPERPSDVKFPWEISRLQWLIPVGQAYLLTQDEQYALCVKNILDDWITQNPFAYSVNWTCTMEVALRIITWTWFFQVFHNSKSWQDNNFRVRFLKTLFLHGDFTARHLEYSDVNGNHYTADAAGLVFAGLFFGRGKTATNWQTLGWKILTTELPRQVFADGVDFEASVPYHRLVLELFLLPAIYRQHCDLPITSEYRQRLIAMAQFASCYSRHAGTVPLWGDADDARTLPFGNQAINDHRYLSGIVGAFFHEKHLQECFASSLSTGSLAEIYWLLGPSVAAQLKKISEPNLLVKSTAFQQGGFYIMRNSVDHIFIDCGPLGLAGRGGHGHNDCLAFEAMLHNELLIVDCGAYLYTASYAERNNFRSTAYHNTPQIDGEEINRFIRPDYLWNMHNDAQPILHTWQTSDTQDIFCGSHTGYERLPDPVKLRRTITLEHQTHALTIQDEFFSAEEHQVRIPLHFAPHVSVQTTSENNVLLLEKNGKQFLLMWDSEQTWDYQIEEARISPSYGVIEPSKKIVWSNQSKNQRLTIRIKHL